MRPGPLLILGAVFAVAFSGRVITLTQAAAEGDGAQQARSDAAESAAPESAADAAPAPEKPSAAPEEKIAAAPGPAPAAAPEISARETIADDELTLLAGIRARAAALDERENRLAEREQLLKVVEKRLETRTQELAELRDEIDARLSGASKQANQDIAHLAKMYESMKPQKAGEIFDAMEPSFAAGFLTEMNSENAALVLSNMSTDNAYAASVIIAGRNAAIKQK